MENYDPNMVRINEQNLEQYIKDAARTVRYLDDEKSDMMHMKLGIYSEIGELVDAFKKNFVYGKDLDLVNVGEELGDIAWYLANTLTIMDLKIKSFDVMLPRKKQIVFDLGEIIVALEYIMKKYSQGIYNSQTIYFCFLLLEEIGRAYGIDLITCMEKNIAKLKIRYPEKWTQDLATNRNLDAERSALEK